MLSSLISAAVLGGLSGLAAAAPNPVPAPQALPAGCSADNCLRAMRNAAKSATAASFCRAYMGVAAVETVIVGTVVPTIRVASTVTSDETATYTRVETATDVLTVRVDTTATVLVTSTTTRALARRTDVPVPDFLRQYPTDRLASACSCMDLPRATERVIFTAPAVTVVAVATVAVTASVDVVETMRTTTTTSIANPPSTTTVRVVATVAPAAPATFVLRGTGTDPSTSGRYLKPATRSLLFGTGGRAEAAAFSLDAADGSLLLLTSGGGDAMPCILGLENDAPEFGFPVRCVARTARDACVAARTCLSPRFAAPAGVLVPANLGGAGRVDATYTVLRGCRDGAGAWYLALTPAVLPPTSVRAGCVVVGLATEAASA
ncbi:hypothetical protein GGTG_10684 [Gaeumannomyces tritici R3-111a-1]|uniref:Uncharacterized protein n=1 Tax=Gaeumannomyces tritici (strain R3-111a-1) TaxID=644352 RepID=J3PB10_GAET3|nr:hypothetical protein GGTG_10684 [Gaeumannomyces tritici R3-111a-1]EJT71426.1 hypothetical protein GGTG_10684 [Gaeumannomyces tritici R3-111a-1]